MHIQHRWTSGTWKMDNVGLNDIELVQIKTNDLNHHLKRQNIDKNCKKIKVKGGQFTTKNFTNESESISSTFYAHIFRTKFWRQNSQSQM